MRYAIIRTLALLLLFIISIGHSQPNNGAVAFDAPNVPSSEFQFDLDRRVIFLVLEDPNAPIAPLFGTVDNLHLRNYRSRSVDFKALVQYYDETLKSRDWDALGQSSQGDVETDNLYLYILQEREMVKGIFVVVRSSGDVYLINITGKIPEKQLGELLLNLNQLGIEIPELMSLRPRDLEVPVPLLPPEPEPVKSVPAPSVTTYIPEEVKPLLEKPPKPIVPKDWQLDDKPKPTVSKKWQFDGRWIHEFRIQSSLSMPEGSDPKSMEEAMASERANIVKVLESGSGDIADVMPILASALLNRSRTVSLRVEEEGTKHIAVITVKDIPRTQKITVLKSLTISGPGGERTQRSILDKSVLPMTNTAAIPTRFLAAEAPIHEIRIRGNRKVSETRIRQTLENGSEDIEQALKSLFEVMPYFEEVRLQVDEENSKYIATITVDEKPLSTNVYLSLNPVLRLGFTRVTGWEIGTGFELGKRKEIGPLWVWNIRDSQSDQTSKLFGKLGYTFGNPHYHYRVGGTANWGKLYVWNLGLTAQIHRLTDVVAPELFQDYNRGVSIFQRLLGVPDFQNYYLRQGAEIALQWTPVMPVHWFKLAMVAESHASLEKSTDWFVTNWTSNLRLRDNPHITPGRMRGIVFQYDFHKRISSLGWHNTLFVEHSSPAVGSDFDFTRLQLHLRYAFPLGNNRIRTRFLFGFSDASLPIQRQFVIGGLGGLRGYPWRRQENESDGIITYKSGHQASPYAFAGERGFLLNVEYHYRLSNLFDGRIYENMFLIAFLDEGQVWNVSDDAYTFNPKGNIGIGLQFGRTEAVTVGNVRGLHSGRDDFIIRLNIAKALEAGTGIQITTAWYHSF